MEATFYDIFHDFHLLFAHNISPFSFADNSLAYVQERLFIKCQIQDHGNCAEYGKAQHSVFDPQNQCGGSCCIQHRHDETRNHNRTNRKAQSFNNIRNRIGHNIFIDKPDPIYHSVQHTNKCSDSNSLQTIFKD